MKHPLSRLRRLPPLSTGGGQRQWPAQVHPRRSPRYPFRPLALSTHALRVSRGALEN